MKSPREKYESDPVYAALVDTLESMVCHAQYTPSEVREAAILACINYEMHTVRPILISKELIGAFKTFEKFIDGGENGNKKERGENNRTSP